MSTASGGGSGASLFNRPAGGGAAAGTDPNAAASAGATGAAAAGGGAAPAAGAQPAAAATGGQQQPAGAANWKERGYEEEWLAGAVDGKYKTKADFVKGHGELYAAFNAKAAETNTLTEKHAELGQKLSKLEGIYGAPVNEDGTPKAYDLKFSEEATVDPELRTAFESWLRDSDLSEKQAQKATEMLETYAAGFAIGNREAELAGVVEFYGGKADVAQTKLNELAEFWTGKVGEKPADIDALYEVASTASGVRFLESLRSRITMVQNGRGVGSGTPETPESIAAEAAGKPNFYEDPKNVARLTAAHERKKASS